MKKRVALIDADTVLYTAALQEETVIEWSDWMHTVHANPQAAAARAASDVERIRRGLDADEIVMALSADGPRWRNEVMPEYKMNRGGGRKPTVLTALRRWCHETYNTIEIPTLEGDDVLGMLATNPLVPGEKIIVAIDKDLRTIPGLHLKYSAEWDETEPGGALDLVEVVSREAAIRFHMKQAVMGDTTDGYKGCPGVGPVSADKLLDAAESGGDGYWSAIVAAYEKAGLSEVEALANARVARICWAHDWDYETNRVRLWTPTAMQI